VGPNGIRMSDHKIEKKRKKSQVDDEVSDKKKKRNKGSEVEKSNNAELMTSHKLDQKKSEPRKTNLDNVDEVSDSQKDEWEMIGNDDVREMKKQKKEKMLKKKEEKKKLKENSKITVGESIDPLQKCIEDSLAYLHNWRDNRSQWKFQKKRQTWLLKHMYDTKIVSDEDFGVLLEYIEPLQGSSRTLTLHQAEGYATVHDSNVSDSEESDEESQEKKPKDKKGWMSSNQLDRVRQVIQLLS